MIYAYIINITFLHCAQLGENKTLRDRRKRRNIKTVFFMFQVKLKSYTCRRKSATGIPDRFFNKLCHIINDSGSSRRCANISEHQRHIFYVAVVLKELCPLQMFSSTVILCPSRIYHLDVISVRWISVHLRCFTEFFILF